MGRAGSSGVAAGYRTGMAQRRVRVTVSGRVQGVGFRAATAERATALGLTGWVRNLTDGRVEAAFQGASDAVDDAVTSCREGPPGAEVDTVEVRDEPPADDEHGFAPR